MRADVGLIGGTGIGSRLRALGGTAVHIPTVDGIVRGRLVERNGCRLLVLSRHGAAHRTPPHGVPYNALARALTRVGARHCVSSAAVGSLRTDWPVGTLAACSDFLDLGARRTTLFANEVVHRDFTEPFGRAGRAELLAAGHRLGLTVQPEAVYIGVNGPRYETPAEIRAFAALGADVVGMTAHSEATTMREAEIDYACLAIVTNLASGIAPSELDHLDVSAVMETSGESAMRLLLDAAECLAA